MIQDPLVAICFIVPRRPLSSTNHSTSNPNQAKPKTHPISETTTMEPSTSTDTTNRTFGTLRKNVVVMVCVLTLITHSLVSNSYYSMLAYVPESQLSFADFPVVNNASDQITGLSLEATTATSLGQALDELNGFNKGNGPCNGTEDTEGPETELAPSIATRRPQRVFELPYEEQKGSWIGNHWVPPNGWRYFSAEELRTVYKDKSIMWVGDSLARRGAATMYGILKEKANSSNVNVPVAEIDAPNVLSVNKNVIKEPCKKWKGSKHQPRWCRSMPRGAGDYAYVVKNKFMDVASFFADEVSGKSKITKNFDTIIIAAGNWDTAAKERKRTLSSVTAAIDMLGKLQSSRKTIIWRTSGFSDSKFKTHPYFFEVNKRALDQINSVATRLQQEKNTVSNLTCINWPGAIFPRSSGSDRIAGDSPSHYGLEARLVLVQMITNHLASRQSLEF
jgi:hypothetical protein